MIIGTNYTTYSNSKPSFRGGSPKDSKEPLKGSSDKAIGKLPQGDVFVSFSGKSKPGSVDVDKIHRMLREGRERIQEEEKETLLKSNSEKESIDKPKSGDQLPSLTPKTGDNRPFASGPSGYKSAVPSASSSPKIDEEYFNALKAEVETNVKTPPSPEEKALARHDKKLRLRNSSSILDRQRAYSPKLLSQQSSKPIPPVPPLPTGLGLIGVEKDLKDIAHEHEVMESRKSSSALDKQRVYIGTDYFDNKKFQRTGAYEQTSPLPSRPPSRASTVTPPPDGYGTVTPPKNIPEKKALEAVKKLTKEASRMFKKKDQED